MEQDRHSETLDVLRSLRESMDRLTEATLRQEELLRQVLPEVQKTETVKRLSKTQKAVADILACIKGRFLAIELKSDRGRLSEDQKFFLERVQIAGGFAMEARSLDEIIEMVELIRETTRLSVPVHAD